jgi:hypothetical protein
MDSLRIKFKDDSQNPIKPTEIMTLPDKGKWKVSRADRSIFFEGAMDFSKHRYSVIPTLFNAISFSCGSVADRLESITVSFKNVSLSNTVTDYVQEKPRFLLSWIVDKESCSIKLINNGAMNLEELYDEIRRFDSFVRYISHLVSVAREEARVIACIKKHHNSVAAIEKLERNRKRLYHLFADASGLF